MKTTTTLKDIEKALLNSEINMNNSWFSEILISFIKKHETLFKKHQQYDTIKAFSLKKKYYSNTVIRQAYAVIFYVNEIFDAFITETNSRAIYQKIATNKYIIKANFSTFLVTYTDKYIFPKLYLSWESDIFGLPFIIRRHLLRFFNAYPAPITPLTTIPETTYVFEGQEAIFNDLPMICVYLQEHELESLKNIRRVKSPEINKFKKHLNGQEFVPKAKRFQGVLRHTFLGNLVLHLPTTFYNKNTTDLLQYLFNNIYLNSQHKSAFTIFSYIKGLDKYKDETQHHWESVILKEIKTLKPNMWYNFDNWFLNVQLEKNIDIFHFNIAMDKIYNSLLFSNFDSYSNKKINEELDFIHERFVDIPFLKGTLFLFAAFGLIDLAYDEIVDKPNFSDDALDPYRGLKYFRLNNLGAFILGLTKTYLLPKIVTNDELFLSKDALVITTHENNKKAKMLLKEYMDEVGKNRYSTDYERFTKKCSSILDVKKKIENFKKIVGEIPNNWQLFFDEIIKNAYPIEEFDKYQVFKIKNNPELIRTIARDEILKKWIIKGEQFHIIILDKDVYKVKKRLRQLGYFIA